MRVSKYFYLDKKCIRSAVILDENNIGFCGNNKIYIVDKSKGTVRGRIYNEIVNTETISL